MKVYIKATFAGMRVTALCPCPCGFPAGFVTYYDEQRIHDSKCGITCQAGWLPPSRVCLPSVDSALSRESLQLLRFTSTRSLVYARMFEYRQLVFAWNLNATADLQVRVGRYL